MLITDINRIFAFTSDLSDLLPLVFFALLSKEKQRQLIPLGVYLLANCLLKIISLSLNIVGNINNMIINNMVIYHVMAFTEFAFLLSYYKVIVPIATKSFNLIMYFILFVNASNTFFLQPVVQFNSYAWSINSIVLIVFGLLYLNELYKNVEEIRLERHATFIINSAILFYLSGSLFTYILGWDILSKYDNGFFHNAWIIKSSSDILKSILLVYGLWLTRSIAIN